MRNTVQRDLIYKVVCDSSDHPAAETVYMRARAVMPNISLGTVYRNLKLLVSLGKVREIPLAEVTDAEVSAIDALAAELKSCSGFEAESTEVMFTGICLKCRAKEKKAV